MDRLKTMKNSIRFSDPFHFQPTFFFRLKSSDFVLFYPRFPNLACFTFDIF